MQFGISSNTITQREIIRAWIIGSSSRVQKSVDAKVPSNARKGSVGCYDITIVTWHDVWMQTIELEIIERIFLRSYWHIDSVGQ